MNLTIFYITTVFKTYNYCHFQYFLCDDKARFLNSDFITHCILVLYKRFNSSKLFCITQLHLKVYFHGIVQVIYRY